MKYKNLPRSLPQRKTAVFRFPRPRSGPFCFPPSEYLSLPALCSFDIFYSFTFNNKNTENQSPLPYPSLATHFSSPLLTVTTKLQSQLPLPPFPFQSTLPLLTGIYPTSQLKRIKTVRSKNSKPSSALSYSPLSHNHLTQPTHLHETFPLSLPPTSLAVFF